MISREDFNRLSEIHAPHCISLYIPITRTDKDRITLKNQIQHSSKILEKTYGLDSRAISKVFDQVKSDSDNPAWWRNHSKGLALFFYNGQTEYFFSSHSLDEKFYVADHLYLLPLAPEIHQNKSVYVMPLSENNVKLYEVSDSQIKECELREDFPRRVEDVVGYDLEEQSLQYREGQGGGDVANNNMFHGQGGGDGSEKKQEYLKFFKALDHEIAKNVNDTNKPLVVACVDYLYPLFKEASHYPNLYDRPLTGNHEHTSKEDLLKETQQILQKFEAQNVNKFKAQFQESVNQSSFENEEIVAAAINGRIDTLFVKTGAELYGTYYPADNSIETSTIDKVDNVSLTNLAAIHTIKNNGNVYLVDENQMPEKESTMNALFRYSVQEN